jgi:arylsulfatase A-like enzyme
VGHAPWIALHAEAEVLERGRTLMLLQDSWLKEIVDTLRNLGTLERTVIAVTGDHGIRTRVEDPVLPIGKISDYTFRVPLLVYAPKTLERNAAVFHPTSHVDFAPTLLALFGQTDSVKGMQGVPVWQRRASDRIYFLAFTYGGADGFAENGTYYMRQGLSGAVYANRTLAFEDRHQARPGDAVIPFVNEALTRADQLQRMLVGQLLTLER